VLFPADPHEKVRRARGKPAEGGKDAANQDTCGLVRRRLLLFRYRDG
jgi:hypothetical protein